MKKFVSAVALALVALCVSVASAQEIKIDTVVGGLNNPCGIAVQPGSGTVFVSDSGAGRVIRIVDGKAQNVITDFPIGSYGKGPKFAIGPLGLAFLDKNTLVVGGGGYKDGEELLRVYTIPAAGKAAIKAAKMKASFKLKPGEELKGEGNFYGVVVTKQGIFVTCNGDDTKGWLGKATVSGTKVGPFKRSIATKEATDVDAPVAITTSPYGDLVVGQMGEVNKPKDSLLTFYSAKTGKKRANFETGLFDITGLAYSPSKKPQLYALDFAWMDTKQGGLYQLLAKRSKDGKQSVKTRKLAPLDKPTAMAFGKDKALYITVIGSGKIGGKLLRIPGLK